MDLKETKNHWNNCIEKFIDRILSGVLLTAIFEVLAKFVLY